jgi:N utilization substance protein B
MEIENDFVNEIVYGVLEHKNDIDKIANKNLNNWTIDRLGKIDEAILRMGIYELVYTDTPEVVAINEAVELSKEYSDEKVKNMINAVLDRIYNGDNKDE